VKITVQNATDDTKLVVAGEEIRRAAWTELIPVSPGATEIVVETPRRSPAKKTVTVAPKEKQAVTIDAAAGAGAPSTTDAAPPATAQADAPKANRASLRPYAYVAGGIGAVGLFTFAIAGMKANSTYSDLKSACPNGHCPSSQSDALSSGKTSQTIANVGLVFGVLGAAGAATLFVLSMPPKSSAEEPKAAIVVGPSYVGVRGSL
jgi:hypothetical protein